MYKANANGVTHKDLIIGRQKHKAVYAGSKLIWEKEDKDINIIEDFVFSQLYAYMQPFPEVEVKGEGYVTMVKSDGTDFKVEFNDYLNFTPISDFPFWNWGGYHKITIHGIIKDLRLSDVYIIESSFPKSMYRVKEMYMSLYRYSSTLDIEYNVFENLPNVEKFEDTFSSSRIQHAGAFFRYTPKAKIFKRVFAGCTELISINSNMFAENLRAAQFIGTFSGCKKMTIVPYRLFAENTMAYDFLLAFSSSGIKKIEGCIFPNNPQRGLDLSHCFDNCQQLEEISQNIFGLLSSMAHDFRHMFSGCTKLETIQKEVFAPLNTQAKHKFDGMFNKCTNLKGIAPQIWEMFPNSTGEKCFEGCTGLTNYKYIPSSWK